MKARVIKPFRDRYTKIIYAKGQEIEVTEERYEELSSAALGPFVEAIKKKNLQKKPANKTKK